MRPDSVVIDSPIFGRVWAKAGAAMPATSRATKTNKCRVMRGCSSILRHCATPLWTYHDHDLRLARGPILAITDPGVPYEKRHSFSRIVSRRRSVDDGALFILEQQRGQGALARLRSGREEGSVLGPGQRRSCAEASLHVRSGKPVRIEAEARRHGRGRR